MGFWMLFWKLTFIIAVSGFAGMAIWVTIGGFFDIKKMFKNLDYTHMNIENTDNS